MTTITVEINNPNNARKLAETLRLFKGVSKVSLAAREGDNETLSPQRIPGLPYTREERILAIRRAEEDYAAGRFVTSDELRKRHPRI